MSERIRTDWPLVLVCCLAAFQGLLAVPLQADELAPNQKSPAPPIATAPTSAAPADADEDLPLGQTCWIEWRRSQNLEYTTGKLIRVSSQWVIVELPSDETAASTPCSADPAILHKVPHITRLFTNVSQIPAQPSTRKWIPRAAVIQWECKSAAWQTFAQRHSDRPKQAASLHTTTSSCTDSCNKQPSLPVQAPTSSPRTGDQWTPDVQFFPVPPQTIYPAATHPAKPVSIHQSRPALRFELQPPAIVHFTQPTAQPQHQQAVPSTSADAVQPTSAAITAGNALAPITPADRVAIPATEAREVRDELARLQGVWNVRVFREHTEDEVTIEAGPVDLQQLEFRQHQLLTLQGGKVVSQATLTLDPTQHPKRMQIQRAAHDSGPRHAVYALDGNTLILCFVEQSADDQELDLSSESKAYRRRLILTRSASSSDTHATITAPLNTVTIVGSPLLLAPGTRCGVTLATSPEEGTPSATTTTAYYGTIAKVTNEKLLLIVTALDRRVTHSQPHPLTSLPWVGTYFQSFQKRYQKNTGVGRESIEPTEFCFDLSSIQSIQVLWDNTIPTNLPKPQPTVAEPK